MGSRRETLDAPVTTLMRVFLKGRGGWEDLPLARLSALRPPVRRGSTQQRVSGFVVGGRRVGSHLHARIVRFYEGRRDDAVYAAYGWNPLLALNLERAGI